MGNAGSGIPPYPVFDAALNAGNLGLAENMARERGSVTLRDALRLLALMAAKNDERYDRAGKKWLARYANECPGVGPGDVERAAGLLDALPDRPGGIARLLDEV